MPSPAEQPNFSQPVVDSGGRCTQPWANYFLRMAAAQSDAELRALYEALAARVAELEDGQTLNFSIFGSDSINVDGVAQPGGVVLITLLGDVDSPGSTMYYGTGPTGSKGWFAVSDSISVAAGELSKAVGTDGVTTLGLADVADSGAGTLQAFTVDSKGRVTGTRPATITGTAQQIDVANGTAAAGLPTLSLATEVLTSLGKADSAVQEVRPGTGISVDNTNPQRPIVSSTVSPGIPEAPNDGYPYARQSLSWAPLDGPNSPYALLRWSVLTDQLGDPLTDQLGRPLLANSAQIPYQWLSGVPANLASVAALSGQGYAFRSSGGAWSLQTLASLQTLPSMTLAAANALTGVNDFQMVAITDLTGGREPCWYDATIASGTKWRRFSDRSVAN